MSLSATLILYHKSKRNARGKFIFFSIFFADASRVTEYGRICHAKNAQNIRTAKLRGNEHGGACMPEELLVRHCAPTLASLKTGNMFACRFCTAKAMYRGIRCVNHRLAGKGLRVLPLRYRDGVGLVYVYRPGKLDADLADTAACQLLAERGYPCGKTNLCVKHLRRRLAQGKDFPHEIGLFLGYPPEDVAGFIDRREARLSGCWKVYGDVEAARQTFARFRKCTDVYVRQYAGGCALERLAVAM